MRRRGLALLALLVSMPGLAHAEPVARSLLERSRLTVGESTEWVVVLENAGMSVPEPQFPGLDWARVQSVGNSKSMSFVNGQVSSAVSYRFLLYPERAGRHAIPAVTFQIGRTVLRSAPVMVDVLPPAPGLSTTGRGNARLRLVVAVDKNRAVVGEPIRMTVRFFQGVRLRSDPEYRAPDVPGFWAEPSAVPRSYYTSDASGRWLVSETRTILYPTVAGRLRIGQARMQCELAGEEDDGASPGLPGGGVTGQMAEIASVPLIVEAVDAPAAGQPRDYRGAVGDFALSVSPERTRVRADETLNLTVRLAGHGNLRLAPLPEWPALDDFQIYSKSSEDSLDLEGDDPVGSKIVHYSLLPRRQGTLTLPGLRYVTYSPGQGYRVLESAGLAVRVDPPLAGMTGLRALQPLEVPRDLHRPPRPWPGWLAALLGAGVALLGAARLARGRRTSARARVEGLVAHARSSLAKARSSADAGAFYVEAERVLEAEELAGLRAAAGPEEEGARRALLARARAARYSPGGAAADLEGFATMLDRHLEAVLIRARAAERPSPVPAWMIAAGLLLILGGLGFGVWRVGASEPGEEAVAVWREAAKKIAAGDSRGAENQLDALWRGGIRGGALAAQTALAAVRERRMGIGALWIERARRETPRDPFVRSVRRVLDEEGALPGHPEGLGTLVTWHELLLAAGALWLLAAGVWAYVLWRGDPKRRTPRAVTLALGAAAVLAGVMSFGVWRSGFDGHAGVVLDPVPLRESPGGREQLDLEPGRLVDLRGASDKWERVGLGGGLTGWVPVSALARVEVPVATAPVAIPTALDTGAHAP